MTQPPLRTAVLLLVALMAAAAAAPALAQSPSPYVDLQDRPIKALSAEQIEQYASGEGMGLALPAELNEYPGPKHVLDLASELALGADQTRAVEAAFDAMHAEAVRLGAEIVDAERRLDAGFASGTITAESLRTALAELARLEGELRYAHLAAHLETRRVLTAEQVERYAALRGYRGPDGAADGPPGGDPRHDHHHHGGGHHHPGASPGEAGPSR
jgi:hypothetical protein